MPRALTLVISKPSRQLRDSLRSWRPRNNVQCASCFWWLLHVS